MSARPYLFVSDFDQALSFNDSGHVLSELLGIRGFGERVKRLSRTNLVPSGAVLTYRILHDPEFRRVRREHLVRTGTRIRLKRDIPLLVGMLARPGQRIVYVGDVSSDIHVMRHVNRTAGLTIAASEARHTASIAQRTVQRELHAGAPSARTATMTGARAYIPRRGARSWYLAARMP